MKPISSALMKRFVIAAGDRLRGDWVIIGGAVLPLSGIDVRVTVDIDIAGPTSSTQAEMLTLMEIGESLGLPVEAINQAGAFFLQKIPNWEKSLVEIYRGTSATIFRPNVNLFIRLKIGRLSESDLNDCIAFLKFARTKQETVDQASLTSNIKKAIKTAAGDRLERLHVLLGEIT